MTEVTFLHLADDHAVVSRGAGPAVTLSQLGLARMERACLRHQPPLALELEQAIELTEEWVMPLAARFSGPHTLVLQGTAATLLEAQLASGPQGQPLEAVEALFNRMAALSQGRPASQDPLPAEPRWCAALLVLREFMHHLHFAHVLLQPGIAAATPPVA